MTKCVGNGRCAPASAQETLFPPREKKIAQRGRIILAIDVSTLDGVKGRHSSAASTTGRSVILMTRRSERSALMVGCEHRLARVNSIFKAVPPTW